MSQQPHERSAVFNGFPESIDRGCKERGGARPGFMYTPYLMCAYAATLLMVLVGMGVVRRSAPDLLGVAHLRRFIVCAICGVLLIALRPQLAPLFSIVVANYVFFAGVTFLYLAVTEILGIPRRLLPAIIVFCILSLPLFIAFTYPRTFPLGRLEIHCGIVALILSASAILLLRHGRGGLLYPARAAATMLGTSAAVHLLWGIVAFYDPPRPLLVMHPDALNAAFSYLAMILGLGNLVSLAWLSFCVHRQDLQTIAQTDSLTGLLNRGAFEACLRRELTRCRTHGQIVGLMLVDLDFFKQVNDEHGHLAGDDVLRRISKSLRSGIRPSDVLARYGGEEFVILLHGAGTVQAEEVAERLRADIADLVNLPGDIRLTASFGVAVSQPEDSVSSLVVRADEALYRSKRDGRNRVRVHSAARPALVR